MIINNLKVANNVLDHEILQPEGLVTYQSGSKIMLAEINPATGMFNGAPRQVDTGASPLELALNGPDFGVDALGWAVFYHKMVGGMQCIFRATPNGGGFTIKQLSSASKSRTSLLPNKCSAEQVHLLYACGGSIIWVREDGFDEEHKITVAHPDTAGFRWVQDSLLYTSTVGEYTDRGQIIFGDARTGEQKIITNDAGIKFDPYGWFAPELGGQPAICANVGSDLVVYDSTGERIKTFALPTNTTMTFAFSPEPFVWGGKSHVVLTLQNDRYIAKATESEIWLYSLDGRQVRIDDGLPRKMRSEGEPYIAANGDLFIYYNIRIVGKSSELWCAKLATGTPMSLEVHELKASA